MRIPQIRLRDGLEALLARCVPELQFDNVVIYLYLLDFEIDAYGAILQRIEVVFGKAQQHGRLAAAGITEHNYLIQCCNFSRLHFLGVQADALPKVCVSLRFLVDYVTRYICIIAYIRLVIVKILKFIIFILIV